MNKLAKESAAGGLDQAGASKFAQLAEGYLRAKTAASGYRSEIQANIESNKSFGASIEEARGKMSSLFQVTGAAAAYEAIRMVGEAISAVGDNARKILTMSEVLGITTAQYQAMGAAAEEAGTNEDVLARANEKLVGTLREARNNSGEAIAKLHELGITNAQILSPTFGLNEAIAAISARLKDGKVSVAEMSAAVALLGGRAAIAAEAWKLYDASAQGVAATNQRLNATSEQQDKALASTGTALKELWTWLGNTTEKTILYTEAIAQVASGHEQPFADLVRGAAEADAALRKLNTAGDRSGVIQRAQQETQAVVASHRTITVAALQGEQEQVEAAASGSAQRVALARQYYEDSRNYYPTAAVPEVKAAYREMEAAVREFGQTQLQELHRQVDAAREKNRDDVQSYKESLREMTDLEREFHTTDRQDAAADISIARSTLEAKKSLLDEQVAANAQAVAAKYAALRSLANDEYALDEESLRNEMTGLDNTSTEYNRIYNDIRVLKAKHVQDMAALDKQQTDAARHAAEQESTAWRGAVNEIEGAESSLVGDLLSKRRSLSQSLLQITGSMLQQELANDIKAMTTRLLLSQTEQNSQKALEQGGLLYHLLFDSEKTRQAVTGETARTAAASTGASTRTAITATASAAQQGIAASTGALTVEADAAKAFAGTYASVAQIPYVGWIMAPGAAAAAFAEVSSMAGIASLDVGAWNVPHDMVAQIHKGETVVPTTYAEGMRQSAGGGGDGGGGGDTHHHNWHVNALDGASLSAVVHSPGFQKELASSMRKHFNRGGR